MLDGLTRLGCEHGFPRYLLLDHEKSFMKAVKDAAVDLRDLSLQCFKERGIMCKPAPVSGNNEQYCNLITWVEKRTLNDNNSSPRVTWVVAGW